MDLFNRIVIILSILAAMILVPVALLFPEQAQFALQYMADTIQANLEWLYSLTPGAQLGVRVMLSAMGMIVFCIGLLFLVLEVIRIRRSTVKLKDGSGELMMNGITGHLAYYVDLLPEVLRAKPSVKSTGKGVQATLYVETAPGVSILEKSAEIRQTARQVLEDQLGLRVKGDVRVVIKPVPYPKVHRARHPLPATAPQPVVPQPEEAEGYAEQVPADLFEAVASPEGSPGDVPAESPGEGEAKGELGSGEVIEVKAPPREDE
jgi:uncharacterized alkaline shock family protein YloU